MWVQFSWPSSAARVREVEGGEGEKREGENLTIQFSWSKSAPAARTAATSACTISPRLNTRPNFFHGVVSPISVGGRPPCLATFKKKVKAHLMDKEAQHLEDPILDMPIIAMQTASLTALRAQPAKYGHHHGGVIRSAVANAARHPPKRIACLLEHRLVHT